MKKNEKNDKNWNKKIIYQNQKEFKKLVSYKKRESLWLMKLI